MLMCALAFGQNATSTGGTTAGAPAVSGPLTLGPVTVTGSVRIRGSAWDWFKPITGENEYQYSGNLVRVNFAQKLKTWDWDAEFFIPVFFGLPTGASRPAPQGALGLGANFYSSNHNNENTAMIFPKQLFVRFNGLGGDAAHSLQIGRFIVNDGTETVPENATLATLKPSRLGGRLLGEFAFAESGRAFDGVRYSYTKSRSNFTFIGAVPDRGVFQVDGWGWNRAAVQYAAYTHGWGSGKHVADTRAFFLEYEDFRDGVLKTDNRPAAVRLADTEHIRVDTYGGHSLHAVATGAGTVDFLGWGAVQTGKWGTQPHRAWGFDVEGGFQPKILPKLKPWVRAGFREGSGDSNPNDNTHNTFFEVLTGPRPWARVPFFDGTNIQDLNAHLILRPHPKVTTTSEFHSLRLANARDFWYSGGGIYQPWSFGYTGRNTLGRRSLANFYDTNFEFRANRKMTLTGYFGYMQGLGSIELIYPSDKNGSYGYGELLYRF